MMIQLFSILCLFTSITSTQAFSAPAPERLQEIRAVISSQVEQPVFAYVDIVINTELKMPAAAFQLDPAKFMIRYSPAIFKTLTATGRDFILFHELGHIRLGHVARPWPGAEEAKEFELEADAFATLLFMQRYPDKISDLREFISFLRARVWTVPSGPERADLCDSLL